jgi:hypothetical protein
MKQDNLSVFIISMLIVVTLILIPSAFTHGAKAATSPSVSPACQTYLYTQFCQTGFDSSYLTLDCAVNGIPGPKDRYSIYYQYVYVNGKKTDGYYGQLWYCRYNKPSSCSTTCS